MFHSVGNFCLSRIQEKLEKDPTFYSEVHHIREFGPLENTAMSWMQGIFLKREDCMPNKDKKYSR